MALALWGLLAFQLSSSSIPHLGLLFCLYSWVLNHPQGRPPPEQTTPRSNNVKILNYDSGINLINSGANDEEINDKKDYFFFFGLFKQHQPFFLWKNFYKAKFGKHFSSLNFVLPKNPLEFNMRVPPNGAHLNVAPAKSPQMTQAISQFLLHFPTIIFLWDAPFTPTVSEFQFYQHDSLGPIYHFGVSYELESLSCWLYSQGINHPRTTRSLGNYIEWYL